MEFTKYMPMYAYRESILRDCANTYFNEEIMEFPQQLKDKVDIAYVIAYVEVTTIIRMKVST